MKRIKPTLRKRDKERISPFLEDFGELWKRYMPDMRFGQIMENLRCYSMTKRGTDLFYLEESAFRELFMEFIEAKFSK